MNDFTISIIGNKIFFEIINELKLFSKFNIKFYDNHDLYIQDSDKENQITLFFDNQLNLKIKSEGKTVENIKMTGNNSHCEDTINFINVKGIVSEISLNNSFSDALDADFSEIKFDKIQIEREYKAITEKITA